MEGSIRIDPRIRFRWFRYGFTFRPVASAPQCHELNSMSDVSNHCAPALSDAHCIDLLIRHRTNPDVSYDDLAYMAGWIYDASVSADDLAAIDAGDARPEISTRLEAILKGEETCASTDDAPSREANGEADDSGAPPSDEEETSEDALRVQYEKYKARQQRWYPEEVQLSFNDFVEALWRWENEYGEAWNLEAPGESDRDTLDELESLLCAPPQSRIFSALITTEASKNRMDDAPSERKPAPPAPDAAPSDPEAQEASGASPSERDVLSNPPEEAPPLPEAGSTEAEAKAPFPVDPIPDPSDPKHDPALPLFTDANPQPTMSEGKNLVSELRARRNALDSSMAAIRESLKHYEEKRNVLDAAISLLEDESFDQMLRLAKQFRSLGGEAAARGPVSEEASDSAHAEEAGSSGDGRSAQQRSFRVTTG